MKKPQLALFVCSRWIIDRGPKNSLKINNLKQLFEQNATIFFIQFVYTSGLDLIIDAH